VKNFEVFYCLLCVEEGNGAFEIFGSDNEDDDEMYFSFSPGKIGEFLTKYDKIIQTEINENNYTPEKYPLVLPGNREIIKNLVNAGIFISIFTDADRDAINEIIREDIWNHMTIPSEDMLDILNIYDSIVFNEEYEN